MADPDINKDIFREEAYELLAELETSLIELEDHPQDMDLVSRVFRAMHTIKGSGAMFGFDEISSFTHEVETVFDLVRNGRLTVTKELINFTLAARDQIKNLLDSPDGCDEAIQDRTEIVNGLRMLADPGSSPLIKVETSGPPTSLAKYEEDGDEATYRIRFRPPADTFRRGIDPMQLIRDTCALGSFTLVAQTDAIAHLSDIDPELCYTYWDIILTTRRNINALRDIFIFVEDDSELKIEQIFGPGEFDPDTGHRKLGDILIERGDLSRDDIDATMKNGKRIGERLVESGVLSPDKVESALAEQRHIKEMQEKRQSKENSSSIRVASEKLDALVNLIGELVTVQAHLSQTAGMSDDPKLNLIAEEVERLTSELRDNTMNIRMLPIGSTFSKFRRLVRDLSGELGKEIELETEGAETELDKTVIEKLNDPMVHLIRNCIDHGIESPDVRVLAGKQRKGIIRLSAQHSGAHVLIRIRDDGAGLDTDAIRNKAIERGLITAASELADKEIFSLVLLPGFSTARNVTSVSGRGVGMDVVKQAIDALKGTIDISSQKGTGTTITLTLPLTLAIIDGLLVRVGADFFVFPLSAVKECIELSRADIRNSHNRRLVNVRGAIVPYIRLREKFNMNNDRAPDLEQVVLVDVDDRTIGFAVDSVVGSHQTVIKSLGAAYRGLRGISGATILGDGTVALILDLLKLVQESEEEEIAFSKDGFMEGSGRS
jgi:two-component system, chemotaxis family, sensor kinase CheA